MYDIRRTYFQNVYLQVKRTVMITNVRTRLYVMIKENVYALLIIMVIFVSTKQVFINKVVFILEPSKLGKRQLVEEAAL